jgi:hypothetical protein
VEKDVKLDMERDVEGLGKGRGRTWKVFNIYNIGDEKYKNFN